MHRVSCRAGKETRRTRTGQGKSQGGDEPQPKPKGSSGLWTTDLTPPWEWPLLVTCMSVIGFQLSLGSGECHVTSKARHLHLAEGSSREGSSNQPFTAGIHSGRGMGAAWWGDLSGEPTASTASLFPNRQDGTYLMGAREGSVEIGTLKTES